MADIGVSRELLDARFRTLGLNSADATHALTAMMKCTHLYGIEIKLLASPAFRYQVRDWILELVPRDVAALNRVLIANAVDRVLHDLVERYQQQLEDVARIAGAKLTGPGSFTVAGEVGVGNITAASDVKTLAPTDPCRLIPAPKPVEGNPYVLVHRTQLLDIIAAWQRSLGCAAHVAEARAEVIFKALVVAYPREE